MQDNHSNMYADATTWNPFKGCGFDCTYCEPSFKRQAKRQAYLCNDCYHYTPHYHENRLAKIPSASIIFVAGNADISFCDYDFATRIIEQIKEHSKRCPTKTYYFQSKRPEYFLPLLSQFPENVILLTTLETNRDGGYERVSKAPPPSVRYEQFKALDYPRKVATLEPLLDFDLDQFFQWIIDLEPEYVWLGLNSKPNAVSLPEPSPEKVTQFMKILVQAGIPVRGKTLRGLEVPEGGRGVMHRNE